jgi:PKD repeat protein
MIVQFTDTSNGDLATSWNWSFGDGRYSNLQNPVYPYAVAGNYTVRLNVTNASTTSTLTKSDYIRLSSDVDDYVVAWLHMNGTNGNTTFRGESGIAWITSGAAKITTGTYKFGGASGDFTGSKAYIWTPHEDKSNFTTQDFTIEMWVRPASSSQWQPIFAKGSNTFTSGYAVYHSTPSAISDGWKFYMGDYTTGSTGVFTLPLNQWSHLVIERISGNVTVFVNGNVVAYKSGLTGNYDTTNPIYLGFSPNKYFGGYLDEARVSIGVARWKSNFITPYDQYKGTLYTEHPDINPDSTFQYKVAVGSPSTIGNGTDYGSGVGVRNRTIQIVNVHNTSFVVGAAYYNASHVTVQNVYLNTSTYSAAGSTLQYNIDHNLGIIQFNVSRPSGFNNGTSPASIIDYQAVYDKYHDPELDPTDGIYFVYGFLINASTGHRYPIHNFVGKSLDYAPWNFTVNFTANTTTQQINNPILFNATFNGAMPEAWNWSWGDGSFTNGTANNVSHNYTATGLKNVSVTGYMTRNTSVSNTMTKTFYINSTEIPVAGFIANQTAKNTYPMVVHFTDQSTDTPVMWNWSFGDGRWINGTTESERNPVYTYAVAGRYNVSLTATSIYGSHTTTKIDYIDLLSDTDAYVSTWMHFNGSPVSPFHDEQGLVWTIIDTPVISTTTYNYADGSGQFTASKSGLKRASYATLNLANNDFTIEFWAYPTQNPEAGSAIIARSNDALTNGWGFVNGNGTEYDYRFFMGDYTSNATSPLYIQNNQWTKIEIERLSGTIYIYKNGILSIVKSGQSGTYDVIGNNVQIAYSNNDIKKQWYGHIDEFRISNGVARWTSDHTTPYAQYIGELNQMYPDINPYSTFRFKIDPAPYPVAYIYNQSSIGRTLQIQNITHTDYIVGSITTDPRYTTITYIQPNASSYNDITLVSYTINNIYGIAEFNITRPGGFESPGDTRKSVVEWGQAYINYSAQEEYQPVYFTYGKLINITTGIAYPVHTFISTNLTYGEWNFTADFTANTTTQAVERPILFNATFTGNYPNKYNWSWGDGTYTDSAEANVSHNYATNGTYTVSVTEYMWQNTSLNSTKTRTNYITVLDVVVADFSSDNHDSAQAPFTVQFYDNSTGGPVAWNWSFGDGTFSELQHSAHGHQYYANYTVTLAISDATSADTITKVDYIHAGIANILVDFNGFPTYQLDPERTVAFTSISYENEPDGYNWSFGDGTYSNEVNPVHSYPYFGFWSPSLTAYNNSSANTTYKPNYIAIAEIPIAGFTGDPTYGYVINQSGEDPLIPASIYFTDNSNNATAWLWDFGDFNNTNTSTEKNPVHEYNVTGTFTVNLTITNAFGLSNTTIIPDYITIDETTAIRIKAEVGETYIRWKWFTDTPYYIMVDGRYITTDVINTVDVNGTPVTFSSTQKLISIANEYAMENLEPNSEHRIALYPTTNATIPSVVGTAKTLPHSTTVYILIIAVLALCVISIVLMYVNPAYVLLLCILNIVISLFGIGIGYNTNGIVYLFYVGIILSGILIAYAVYKMFGEDISWW